MILSASVWAERDLQTELCIIGAGAAGLEMARFFNGAPLSVVVLEGGSLEFDPSTQRLHQVRSVGKEIRARSSEFNPHLPPPYQAESRIRQFGGTTNIWSGKWKAHVPDDFQEKNWIPHSGWPISYSELLLYYLEVTRDYAIPPGLLGHEAVDDAGGHAEHPLQYTSHYEQSPPANFNNEFKSELESSENVTVILNANAVRLFADPPTNAITHVAAKGLRGSATRVRARVFVLAAGGFENARLLLNSPGPSGVAPGNHHDLVGRFYMDHPKVVWGRLTAPSSQRLEDKLAFTLEHGSVRRGLAFSEDFRRAHRLPNHTTYLRAPSSGRVEDAPPAHCAATYELLHYLEQVPNPDSRVYLSPTVRDELDEPVLVVDWRLSELDRAAFERYLHLMREALAARGFGHVSYPAQRFDLDILTDAAHHMGTTRMATSRAHGVVDGNCRVFGVDNLYVIGSSVFTTAGNANPTLTILALTRRLCHHLTQAGLVEAPAPLVPGVSGGV